MKSLFTLLMLSAVPAFAAIEVCRITPDKIVYPVNTDGKMTVVLKNTGKSVEKGVLTVTESWNLEDGRQIAKRNVTLKGGETQTLLIPYNSGTHRYGRTVQAQVMQNGKVTGSRREYFNVINEWWRVSMGPGAGGAIDGKITPLFKKVMSYYGLKIRPPKNSKYKDRYPHSYFSHEQWEARSPELGPFLGYGNMETRWQMSRANFGGNLSPYRDFTPDQLWFAHKFEPRRSRQVYKDSDEFHKWGMHHTRYTINNMESSYGFEQARKYPQYILRNDRGGFEGFYMHDRVSPIKVSRLNTPCHEWVYLTPNLFEKEVLEWGLDDLIAGIKAAREDGVYFDGRYCVHGGFDHLGNDLKKKYDVNATVVRNMKRVLERFDKELPDSFIWSNGCDDSSPESELLSTPRTGVLREIQQSFITSPTRIYHRWRGLLEALIGNRDQLFKPSKNSRIKTNILFVGYLATFNRKDLIPTRECWTWSNHVMAIIASVLGHPLGTQVQFRPVRQMQTGFSEFYWHEDIDVLKNGYRMFQLDSLREIWYEDTIYTRKTAKYTDYYIHLINTPETDNAIDTVRVDPPEADDVEIATKRLTGRIRAWAIQPYGYNAKILEPTVKEIKPKKVKKETVFAVPPFKFYTLLVIRKYH